jgi:hypothetical protein
VKGKSSDDQMQELLLDDRRAPRTRPAAGERTEADGAGVRHPVAALLVAGRPLFGGLSDEEGDDRRPADPERLGQHPADAIAGADAAMAVLSRAMERIEGGPFADEDDAA